MLAVVFADLFLVLAPFVVDPSVVAVVLAVVFVHPFALAIDLVVLVVDLSVVFVDLSVVLFHLFFPIGNKLKSQHLYCCSDIAIAYTDN